MQARRELGRIDSPLSHLGPGDQTQVVNLGGTCLYLSSHSLVQCVPILILQGDDIWRLWVMKIDLLGVVFLPIIKEAKGRSFLPSHSMRTKQKVSYESSRGPP